MALLPILRYPDPRLHTVAKPVAEVDDTIKQLDFLLDKVPPEWEFYYGSSW